MNANVKENIISVATLLFAEKGLEGASVRDIAKKAKVNVAMISYYFCKKENLYMACIENFAQHKIELMKDILQPVTTKEDFKLRLQLFLQSMISTYTKDAPVLKILMREMQHERKGVTDKLIKKINPFFFMLRDFFQSAIDAKVLKSSCEADHVTFIFLGALSHPCDAEIAMKKTLGYTMHDVSFQKKYSEQLMRLFLNGVLNEKD